ncbi:MAG: Rrf2 family transcriptional regulator [Erysipelotrichaceae bacterium]|nr:Rrf2 family transcriptional regulator [Erysipelotrichaceae bacterium]
MQISSRLTMAVHMLVYINVHSNEKVTSDMMAKSVNTNPVIIRRLLSQLKEAEIITVTRGTGGVEIIKPLNKITLLDIYYAVECVGEENLFAFHNPNKRDKVGRKIHPALDDRLLNAQNALEKQLSKVNLSQIINDIKQ